jgi:bifunctional DNA-binding transcriptional regulator/antitoxin component of YhaV-PrlF toxin-antitoxin module
VVIGPSASVDAAGAPHRRENREDGQAPGRTGSRRSLRTRLTNPHAATLAPFTNSLTPIPPCGSIEASPHMGAITRGMTTESHTPHSYHARIDTAGRLTIPVELRARHGLHTGDEVLLVPHAGGLEIKTYDQAADDAQRLFCRAAPKSRMLSEELIAQRRHDAASDD